MVGETQRKASKFIVFEQFEKLNTQSVRQALKENELAWLENLQPIAPNNLAAVPGPARVALATVSTPITSLWYGLINGIDFLFAFATNGSAFSINIATGLVNQFAGIGTFSLVPDLTTWQATRILINDPVAGYSTYDGTLFVTQGGVSPVFNVTNGGSGYSTAPSVTITGGSGTGATAIATIVNGVVVAVVLTNPGIGYKAGDVLTVTFGTGVGSGATGHVTMSGFPVSSVTVASSSGQVTPNGTFALVFTGGGGTGGAAGTVTVTAGKITSITITAGGSYASTPVATCPSITSATFNTFMGTQVVATIVLDTGGSLYVSPPNVTISGGLAGGGVAATAHSTIGAGIVTALILDTVGSGYTSTPIVIIGTGSGAVANGHVWPFVPKGTTLAVFQGRVWLNFLGTGGNFNGLQYTGTQGFDDFAAANASASLIISDSDLIHAITALRSANNYLYIMGDQSVKQIGNISLNNAGNVTLFTILTLSSDQGTIWPRSCGSYNRVFMFANPNGIYAVVGSSVQKISDDLDGIFRLIDFAFVGQQDVQASIVDIRNIHNISFLVRYLDPLTVERSILLIFNGKKWFIGAQGDNLVTMATSALLSTGKTQLWGSSGTDITALFADATVPVKFKWQSSLSHHGNAVQRKKVVRAGFAVTMGANGQLTMTVDSDERSITYTQTLAAGFQALSFQTDNAYKSVDGAGRYLGMTITGTLAGFIGSNMTIEFQDTNVGNRNLP